MAPSLKARCLSAAVLVFGISWLSASGGPVSRAGEDEACDSSAGCSGEDAADDVQLLQVVNQPADVSSRQLCTADGDDPWRSGKEVHCCQPLLTCLAPWDPRQPTNWSYRCAAAGSAAARNSECSPKPQRTATCTQEASDPFHTGGEVRCCPGLLSCLAAWDAADPSRWFYKCYPSGSDMARRAKCTHPPAPDVLPERYYPHFDTTPDYLGIAGQAAGLGGNPGEVSDNFYLVIGDQGGCDGGCQGCCERQMAVADKMDTFVRERKATHPHSKLLFVLAVGDSFYWTGVGADHRFRQTWLDVYGPELTGVPWFPVYGNHDYGNDDAGAACPSARPRFTCIEGSTDAACGGARPYSTMQQAYDSNQLNADKGGLGGGVRDNWHMPDYTYFYTIPGLDFELVAMDWNGEDLAGLGGDGPYKGAQKSLDICGSLPALRNSLNTIKDASTRLLVERALNATHRNVAIIGHYPPYFQNNVDFRSMYLEKLPSSKKAGTKVFNFFGHTHTQACLGRSDGECVNFQTGGGGGCCVSGDQPAGFTVIGFKSDNGIIRQFTDCFAPDARCSLTHFNQLSSDSPAPLPAADDVCAHTVDSPECPGYPSACAAASAYDE